MQEAGLPQWLAERMNHYTVAVSSSTASPPLFFEQFFLKLLRQSNMILGQHRACCPLVKSNCVHVQVTKERL